MTAWIVPRCQNQFRPKLWSARHPMLRIYRYLASASAIVLFLALAMVAWFYHQQAVRDLTEMSAKHNIGIDRILLNTIWNRYGNYIAATRNLDADGLRARPETQEIDAAIRALTGGMHVLKVKIYSKEGTTIFSTDPSQIGGDYSNSAAFMTAARDGEPSSALSFKDRFSAFSGEVFLRDIVETYVPIFDDNREIVGVFEVYTDVTDVKERIDRTTITMLVGLVGIFGASYGVLVFGFMRRAIAPIHLASRHAAEIGPRSSGVRLPTQGMPKEILPLIVSTNGALDRLDRALDSQRQFSADAAHELLTPLAVLQAHLDTLEDRSVAAALREDVDSMTDVVHQLLDLAELESHSEAVDDVGPADLHDICAEVIATLAPLAVRDKKQLALTGSEKPILVRGCERMLFRAIRNLIENALAHTPPGTTVEARLSHSGKVQVIDQGEGVPPEEREAIFHRFWRGDQKTGPGAGLGLSIVKRIVESMGGEIAVDDAPGGGAVFTIRLVAVEPASDEEGIERSPDL